MTKKILHINKIQKRDKIPLQLNNKTINKTLKSAKS